MLPFIDYWMKKISSMERISALSNPVCQVHFLFFCYKVLKQLILNLNHYLKISRPVLINNMFWMFHICCLLLRTNLRWKGVLNILHFNWSSYDKASFKKQKNKKKKKKKYKYKSYKYIEFSIQKKIFRVKI